MNERKTPALGTLRDRVELLSNVQTVDGTGGLNDNFVSLGFAWAKVRSLAGVLASAQDGRNSRISHSVVLRFRTDLEPGDALVYRGQRLEILSAADLNGRRAYLSCQCSQLEPMG